MELRTRAAVAAVAILLSLGSVACSSTDGGTDGGSNSAQDAAALDQAKAEVDEYTANPALVVEPLSRVPDKGMKVASVTCTVSSCYPGQFTAAAEALGWESTEYTYDLAQGPSAFVAAVRQALQAKPESLAILFVYPIDVIADEIEQAKADGVVLVDVASALDAPPEGFISCVYCNTALAAYGKLMGTVAAVDAEGNSEFGVVGDKTLDANRISGGATVEELQRVSPNAEVHEINVGYSKTPQENAQTVIAALQRNPKIEYLVFQSPDLMAGIKQALGAAGMADKIKVVSVGPTSPDMLMEIESGFPNTWVGSEGESIAWSAVNQIARHSVGDPVDAVAPTTNRVITVDNAEPEMYVPLNYREAFTSAWGVA